MGAWVMLLAFLGVGIANVYGNRCCLPGQVLGKDSKGFHCRVLHTDPAEKSLVSLTCPRMVFVDSRTDEYIINEDGELQFILPNRIVSYESDSYCEAIAVNQTTRGTRHVALVCVNPERVIHENVYAYCMIISAVFLVATAARYLTGTGLRDLLGKSVINLCASMAIAQIILVVMRLMSYLDMNWCAVRGFSAYYFVLVGFFWMHAISVQTLHSRRHGESPDVQKSADRKQYILYCVYAWGIPAVFTAATALVNFMPGNHLKPGIGLNHCWFFDVKQQWQYMYSIMAVLTVANIVSFAIVTVKMCCSSEAHSASFKQKFTTCVQLFVAMGIPWVFEMAGSVSPPHLAWEIIDLFNALQGVWIFLVLAVYPLRWRTNNKQQYTINIISAELPYHKLEK